MDRHTIVPRMIHFACHCGHSFDLDDSQAAGEVQCPQCGRLNDVPTRADLQFLGEDGSLELKPVEVAEEPDRLAVLSQIYAKGRQDAEGNDIDFRPRPEDLAVRGVPVARDPEKIHRPRYDPETGQLMRPIDVVPEPPRKAIPVAAPALNYASRSTIHTGSILSPRELFKPVNLFVMFCVTFVMLLAGLGNLIVFLHFYMFAAPLAVLELLVIAHYGATIEELGPRQRDDLPRLLGDVQFHDDIFAPLQATAIALLLCYGPTLICFNLPITDYLAIPLGLLCAGAGTYLFPVVAMTLITSGTLSNLRPDRLVGTINACGLSYVWATTSWMLAGGVYLWANLRVFYPLLGHAKWAIEMMPTAVTMLIAVPFIHLLTVPFAHLFAWQTGMLYRQYFDAFPWVGQRFEKHPQPAKKL